MPYQKGEGKSVVIALGGNALGNTPQEQLELVKATAKNIVDMVEEGINVVVSHGNGPQVGMINNAFAYASANDGKTPEMPFPEAGAMSQGYIGYQLSQAILNDLKHRGINRSTACVVTQTVVDPEDPRAAAACRCSRRTACTRASRRSSTRTARRPSWPPTSVPTCWSS